MKYMYGRTMHVRIFNFFFGDFQVYFLEGFSQFQKKNGLHLIFSQPKRIRLPGTYSPLLWVARRNFLYRALCSLWVKETDSALVHYYDPHGEGERLLFIVYIYIVCNCAESFTFKWFVEIPVCLQLWIPIYSHARWRQKIYQGNKHSMQRCIHDLQLLDRIYCNFFGNNILKYVQKKISDLLLVSRQLSSTAWMWDSDAQVEDLSHPSATLAPY